MGTTTVTLANGATTTIVDTKGLNYTGLISPMVKAIQQIANLADAFKSKLIAWFADSANGIGDFYAHRGIFDQVCARKSDGTLECLTGDQLAAMAAGAQTVGPVTTGAPSGQLATGELNASTTSSTTSPGSPQPSAQVAATLTLNGNNPVDWQANTAWQDNLGALFTHGGQSETIYSTTTIDTIVSGTATLDYWATVPSSQEVLHATRAVVVSGPASSGATDTGTSTPHRQRQPSPARSNGHQHSHLNQPINHGPTARPYGRASSSIRELNRIHFP